MKWPDWITGLAAWPLGVGEPDGGGGAAPTHVTLSVLPDPASSAGDDPASSAGGDAASSAGDEPASSAGDDAARFEGVLELRADGVVLDGARLPAVVGPRGVPLPPLLAAASSWAVEQEREGTLFRLAGAGEPARGGRLEAAGPATAGGFRLTLRPDASRLQGDLQEPDVLHALRELAARHPAVRFRLHLPAGVRDVQRARAALDSRPPGQRD